MLHDYNTPFQLARLEDDDDEEEIDSPDDAELYDVEVNVFIQLSERCTAIYGD